MCASLQAATSTESPLKLLFGTACTLPVSGLRWYCTFGDTLTALRVSLRLKLAEGMKKNEPTKAKKGLFPR